MNILFAILAVVLCTGVGLYQAARLSERERLLSEIILMLEEMAIHIRYNAAKAEELFKELDRFEFIKSINSILKNNTDNSWHGAWEKAVKELNAFSPDDRDILLSVGSSLGSTDIGGQLAMLELNKKFFKSRLTDAETEKRRKSNMYRSVGVLMGIAIAVVII